MADVVSGIDLFKQMSDDEFFGGTMVQHLYLNSAINRDSMQKLKDDIMLAAHGHENPEVAPLPIVLHINSPGGACFPGMSMMSIFNECCVPICVCIDGMSCSAATLISILAPYRVMTPHAVSLVHDYTSFTFFSIDKREDLLFDNNQMEVWTQSIKDMYLARTNLSVKELDTLMGRDLMLNADYCLKHAIVDRVLKLGQVGSQVVEKKNLTKRMSLDVVLKKANLNHMRFDSTCYDENIKKIDGMLAAGSALKPVIIHIDAKSTSWMFDPSVIARMMALSRTTLTYAVIDTHVSLTDFIPALFCHKKVMYAHAALVIHMVYNTEFGWMLRDVVENTHAHMNMIKSILREKTKLPVDIVNEIQSTRFLLSAEDCLKYGLVDEVIGVFQKRKALTTVKK
jgi:ATP-dependent protease ClpP protease subunit